MEKRDVTLVNTGNRRKQEDGRTFEQQRKEEKERTNFARRKRKRRNIGEEK